MTKAAFRREVRRQFSALSAEAQGVASKRAFGLEVFWWDGLTVLELERLVGAIVHARLVVDETV